jgi:hypothetical protein
MTFTRLMIVYARDAEAHHRIERDFCEAKEHLADEPACVRSEVLSQDDGLMVSLVTVWASREAAVWFDSGGLNNLLMTVTARHIRGTPVVKLFRVIC